jgi:hydroxypyruvate reductase
MFDAAVAVAQPERVEFLPPTGSPKGRTIVIGAGKASAAMARALEDHWPGPLSGLVVTRYGHGAECRRIEIVEASHPVPDAAGWDAARRILELAKGATEDDLVIALISGGGSALLSLPAPGLTLEDKQGINQALLKSGAHIGQMNCVRKHLSAIKGGRLATPAYPAPLLTLAISDVPGDDPSVIASGPTVADPTTFADARAVLARYGITEPAAALRHIEQSKDETPKPGDPRLARAQTVLLQPRRCHWRLPPGGRRAGVTPMILGDAIEGEAREVGRVMAGIVRQVLLHANPRRRPGIAVWWRDDRDRARQRPGGRNVELMLRWRSI